MQKISFVHALTAEQKCTFEQLSLFETDTLGLILLLFLNRDIQLRVHRQVAYLY